MASAESLHEFYMTVALDAAKLSKAERKKVGGVLVADDNIISYGWNGTPSGDDNTCEIEIDGVLVTKPEVTHCEMNIFGKLLDSERPSSTKNSKLYVTLSPCFECAKLIKRSGVSDVIYYEEYRNTDGIEFLSSRGVNVSKFSDLIPNEKRETSN